MRVPVKLDLTQREMIVLALEIGDRVGYGNLIMRLSSAWRLVLAEKMPAMSVDGLLAASFACGFRLNLVQTKDRIRLLDADRAMTFHRDYP